MKTQRLIFQLSIIGVELGPIEKIKWLQNILLILQCLMILKIEKQYTSSWKMLLPSKLGALPFSSLWLFSAIIDFRGNGNWAGFLNLRIIDWRPWLIRRRRCQGIKYQMKKSFRANNLTKSLLILFYCF